MPLIELFSFQYKNIYKSAHFHNKQPQSRILNKTGYPIKFKCSQTKYCYNPKNNRNKEEDWKGKKVKKNYKLESQHQWLKNKI